MKFAAGVVLAVLLIGPLSAQVSDDAILDSIVANPVLTWGQAVWLAGRATGTFDDSITSDDALNRAVASGWAIKGKKADDPVDLAGYCQVLVSSMGFKGGLLYSWFPGPRYAYRELTFRRIVPGTLGPETPLSGVDALQYLQNAQTWKDAHS